MKFPSKKFKKEWNYKIIKYEQHGYCINSINKQMEKFLSGSEKAKKSKVILSWDFALILNCK